MMYVEFMKNFLLANWSELMAVRLILASRAQKQVDSYFVDMMYVDFMKNFLLADSREMMAVRLILASWAKKRLIPTFYTSCTSSSWKFSSRRIDRVLAVRLIFGILSPKTSHSYLVYMMYDELITNVLLADSSVVIGC